MRGLGTSPIHAGQGLLEIDFDFVDHRLIVRMSFLDKSSPVHFFWGSFDLAVTRFSGREAPLHPGGIPGLPDAITYDAAASPGNWDRRLDCAVGQPRRPRTVHAGNVRSRDAQAPAPP